MEVRFFLTFHKICTLCEKMNSSVERENKCCGGIVMKKMISTVSILRTMVMKRTKIATTSATRQVSSICKTRDIVSHVTELQVWIVVHYCTGTSGGNPSEYDDCKDEKKVRDWVRKIQDLVFFSPNLNGRDRFFTRKKLFLKDKK